MIRITDSGANYGQDDRLITSPKDFLESEPGEEHQESGSRHKTHEKFNRAAVSPGNNAQKRSKVVVPFKHAKSPQQAMDDV